jgi:hypothetical protein
VRTVRTKTRLRNSKDDRFYDDSTHDAGMINRRGRMRIRSRDMTRRIISIRESTQVKTPSSSIFLFKDKDSDVLS